MIDRSVGLHVPRITDEGQSRSGTLIPASWGIAEVPLQRQEVNVIAKSTGVISAYEISEITESAGQVRGSALYVLGDVVGALVPDFVIRISHLRVVCYHIAVSSGRC